MKFKKHEQKVGITNTMPVGYKWDDKEQKTVLRFIVTDPWNWRDYHKAVQMSGFALHGIKHDVDVIVDLSSSQHYPAGAAVHVRTFGRRINPALTGRAIVIGMNTELIEQLAGDPNSTQLQAGEQTLYFCKTEEAAQQLLSKWHSV